MLRPLSANDGDAVHRLDTSLTGGSRTEFLRRRLLRALRAPRERLQIAADDRGALQGFLLARVAGGEFGRPHRVAVIEAVGVAPEAGHAGLGHRLVDALAELALPREVREIASQARWTDRSILALFEWAGFSLAPRHILERGTRLSLREEEDEDEADGEDRSSRVCALHAGDVDAIVAIDQRITGFDRGSYLTRIVEEALGESAVQVSLVAEEDGHVIGQLMARMDWGDSERVEGSATIHTLGVDPRFDGAGHGAALLRQLLRNLCALGVEGVETEVERSSFPLLGWFYARGFEPSQRLAFRRVPG